MSQAEGPRSSITTALLVTGAMLAVYYATQQYFAPPPPEQTPPSAEVEGGQSAREAAEARRDAPERQQRLQTATITAPDGRMTATVDNLGGGLTHVALTDPRFREAESELELVSTRLEQYRPLRVDVPGIGIPPDAVWDLEQVSPSAVRLRWAGNGIEVTRQLEAGSGPYQLWQTTTVKNVASYARAARLRVSTWHYVTREEESSGSMLSFLGNRSPKISQGLCHHEGETTRKPRQDLLQRHGYGNGVEFVAIENAYFVQALAPEETQAEFCGFEADNRYENGEEVGSLFEASLIYPTTQIEPGAEHSWRTLAYVGPKVPTYLESAGHSLHEVVNLGTFATIGRWFSTLLGWIHGFVGNWGIAIILMTILVRGVLFPLNQAAAKPMAQTRKLKPEMDAINEKYADDFAKKNEAIQNLYRKHGINPAASLLGCLPLLLQMPIFFALYASLQSNIELYHQPFFGWWTDLSAPDPFFVLPLCVGALMWLQQRMTPTSLDPAQAKVMQIMPVMVTGFMLFVPAGLCLYMLTSSVLGIAQQRFNEWRYAREDAAKATVDAAAQVSEDAGSNEPKGSGRSGGAKGGPGRSSGRTRRG